MEIEPLYEPWSKFSIRGLHRDWATRLYIMKSFDYNSYCLVFLSCGFWPLGDHCCLPHIPGRDPRCSALSLTLHFDDDDHYLGC